MNLEHSLEHIDPFLKTLSGEFLTGVPFDCRMMTAFMFRGFLPMAAKFSGNQQLVLKLHYKRCLLPLSGFRYSKSTRKRASSYYITINTAFDQCVAGINAQHSESWFLPQLAAELKTLNACPLNHIRVYSIELWRDNILAAGEIGYTAGSIYTSLSGFHHENSAGTVQMYALGGLLRVCGFAIWDLGMEIEYKLNMGARSYDRDTFLRLLSQHRNDERVIPAKPYSAAELCAIGKP